MFPLPQIAFPMPGFFCPASFYFPKKVFSENDFCASQLFRVAFTFFEKTNIFYKVTPTTICYNAVFQTDISLIKQNVIPQGAGLYLLDK